MGTNESAQSARARPITIGLLVGLVVAAVSIAGFALTGREAVHTTVEKVVESRLQQHKIADIDIAHPSISKEFVSRGVYIERLTDVSVRLKAVEAALYDLRDEVRQLRRNGRRGSR